MKAYYADYLEEGYATDDDDDDFAYEVEDVGFEYEPVELDVEIVDIDFKFSPVLMDWLLSHYNRKSYLGATVG